MNTFGRLARLLTVLGLACCTGCYYAARMPPAGVPGARVPDDAGRWWLFLAVAAGVAAASGVSAALAASKDDPDRRTVGVAVAAGGAILAFLSIG